MGMDRQHTRLGICLILRLYNEKLASAKADASFLFGTEKEQGQKHKMFLPPLFLKEVFMNSRYLVGHYHSIAAVFSLVNNAG